MGALRAGSCIGHLPHDLETRVWERNPAGPEVWFEQMTLPRALRREGSALVHATNCFLPLRRPCPGVVTIHDLAFEDHRGGLRPHDRREVPLLRAARGPRRRARHLRQRLHRRRRHAPLRRRRGAASAWCPTRRRCRSARRRRRRRALPAGGRRPAREEEPRSASSQAWSMLGTGPHRLVLAGAAASSRRAAARRSRRSATSTTSASTR